MFKKMAKQNLSVKGVIPPGAFTDEIFPKSWHKKVNGKRGYSLRGLVQKKTTFFGNLSQMARPPPTPPFWDILFTKKISVYLAF